MIIHGEVVQPPKGLHAAVREIRNAIYDAEIKLRRYNPTMNEETRKHWLKIALIMGEKKASEL